MAGLVVGLAASGLLAGCATASAPRFPTPQPITGPSVEGSFQLPVRVRDGFDRTAFVLGAELRAGLGGWVDAGLGGLFAFIPPVPGGVGATADVRVALKRSDVFQLGVNPEAMFGWELQRPDHSYLLLKLPVSMALAVAKEGQYWWVMGGSILRGRLNPAPGWPDPDGFQSGGGVFTALARRSNSRSVMMGVDVLHLPAGGDPVSMSSTEPAVTTVVLFFRQEVGR